MESQIDVNYNDVMVDVYNTIVSTKYPWPKGFTFDEKIQFIIKLNEYFESISDFDKCAALQIVKTKLRPSGKKEKKSNISSGI